MTGTQDHILARFRDGQFDPGKRLDDQLSNFNESCLVGMVETGEATLDDMHEVGGVVLASRIAKRLNETEQGQ